MSCGDCTIAGCTLFSPLGEGKYPVTLVAKFSDTFAPVISLITPVFSDSVDRQVAMKVTRTTPSRRPSARSMVRRSGPARRATVTCSKRARTRSRRRSRTRPATRARSARRPRSTSSTRRSSVDRPFSADARPAFTYSTAAGVAFECSLDGAAFSACGNKTDGKASLQVGPLEDGQHSFRVRAKDGPDYDHVPAARTWTVDTTPPPPRWTRSPARVRALFKRSTPETFAFSLNEAGSAECRSTARPSAPAPARSRCPRSPRAPTSSVRGTDLAGNLGAATDARLRGRGARR